MLDTLDPSETATEHGKAYRAMRLVMLPASFLASVAAVGVMLTLLAVGLWEMVHGVAVFLGRAAFDPKQYDSPASAALQMSAKGLEFLFLAPLGVLLVIGVSKYVAARISPASKSKGNREKLVEEARIELLVVKAFTVSLFAAVIAASMVSQALSVNGLKYESTACGGFLIIVLASYFFMLERLIAEGRRSI